MKRPNDLTPTELSAGFSGGARHSRNGSHNGEADSNKIMTGPMMKPTETFRRTKHEEFKGTIQLRNKCIQQTNHTNMKKRKTYH